MQVVLMHLLSSLEEGASLPSHIFISLLSTLSLLLINILPVALPLPHV